MRSHATPTVEQFWQVYDAMARGDCWVGGAQVKPAPRWVLDALYFLASTGARVGELATTLWSDFDLAQGRWTLPDREGVKIARQVILPSDLVEHLEAMRAEDPASLRLLPASETTVKVHLNAYYLHCLDWERLGQPRWTTHAIRRMVLNAYYQAGADIGVVAA